MSKATYAVVENTTNSWTGEKCSKIVFKSENLLQSFEYLEEQEDYLKARSYHDGGSPISYSYQIDTYLNKEK